MSAPKTIQLPYNWWTDRAGHAVELIIAHNTVGTDSRAYLSRGGELPDGSDRKVSIHILVSKDGTVYRYVPDERGANHAGFGTLPPGFTHVNPNLVSLSFELENASDGDTVVDSYTEAQLRAMGYVIRAWRQKYGPLPILRHADIDPKRRKDTVGLSVAQIEAWAKSDTPPPPAPLVMEYLGLTVFQLPSLTGPIAGYLPSDSTVTIDATTGPGYAASAGHLASGAGFVDMRQLRKKL